MVTDCDEEGSYDIDYCQKDNDYKVWKQTDN